MNNKYIFGISLVGILTFGGFNQAQAQLQSFTGKAPLKNDLVSNKMKRVNHKATAVCGTDTVNYPQLKATGLAILSLNNATSGFAAGQYYNASDSVTVNGFDFFAFKTDTANGTTINISAEIYLAGMDSLPMGLPLATQTVTIDTTFGGGVLSAFSQTVSFTTPVTVTAPYVLVVSNNSPTNIGVVSNSYTAGNGAFEDLASLNIGGNWLPGSSVNVGAVTFNADFLYFPHVDYKLKTDFSLNPDSLYGAPSTISVTNTTNSIINDRMYNFNAAVNLVSNTYDFGNGGGSANVQDSMVTYTNLQNYTITLLDTIRQFNGGLCVSSETKVLAVARTTGLNNIDGENVDFTIFPNPSKGNLTLVTPLTNERVLIHSIDGKLVAEQLIITERTNLELSNLSNGVYFVTIGNTSKKLVIK